MSVHRSRHYNKRKCRCIHPRLLPIRPVRVELMDHLCLVLGYNPVARTLDPFHPFAIRRCVSGNVIWNFLGTSIHVAVAFGPRRYRASSTYWNNHQRNGAWLAVVYAVIVSSFSVVFCCCKPIPIDSDNFCSIENERKDLLSCREIIIARSLTLYYPIIEK